MAKPYLLIIMLFSSFVRGWAQPLISGISPSSGSVGTVVTISGAQFDPVAANDIVYFGAARAAVSTASASSLTVTVPAGANYQPVTVTCDQLTAYYYHPFRLTFSGAPAAFGSTSFSAPIVFSNTDNLYFQQSAAADMDGDGKPDMVLTTGGQVNLLSVFRNTSQGGLISFAQSDFSLGNSPRDMAVGDLDGDGLADVAIAGNTSGISLLRNMSGGGVVKFSQPVFLSQFSLLDEAFSVAIGDLDGDGKPDLATVHVNNGVEGQTPMLTIYLNTTVNGVLSFATGINLVAGNGAGKIVLSDLDGDGKTDLAIINQTDNTISVFKNTSSAGALSFTAATTYSTGANPVWITAGDLDGDGKAELVVVNAGSYPNYGNTVSVFENTSNGSLSFAAQTTYTTGRNPSSVAIGDLNGDGKPELSVSYDSSGVAGVSVLRNTGSSFTAAQNYLCGLYSYQVAIADMDGDGYPDITTMAYSTFIVFKSQITAPAGNFEPPVISSFSPHSGAIGSSVTISGSNFSPTAAGNIVHFGAVAATVTAASANSITVTVPPGASYQPITVTCNALTAATRIPFNVTFTGGTAPFGPQSFVKEANLAGGVSPFSPITGGVAGADLDGDGKPDLLMGDYGSDSVYVFRNTGVAGPSLFGQRLALFSYQPYAVAIADIDGDGKPDLIAAGYVGISVWKNTSSPGVLSFAPATLVSGGLGFSVAVADMDGDGKPDIVTGNGGSFTVYRNTSINGAIVFSTYNTFPVYYGGSMGLALVNLDADNLPDVVAVGGNLSVCKNTSTPGAMSFGEAVNFSAGNNPQLVAAGDLRGDGGTELAVANYDDSTISIFGSITTQSSYATRTDIKTPWEPYAIAMTDLNGDGLPDLAATSLADSSVFVLKNTTTASGISFSPFVNYQTSLGNPAALSLGDLDGDGLPDLAVTDGSHIEVLTNQIEVPQITSFTPMLVDAGTTVTINGYNFTGATAVSFGGIPVASFTVVSATQITAVAGEGEGGLVTVTTPFGTVSLGTIAFNPPSISGFTPSKGPTSSTVTLTGVHFSVVPANNIVYFGAVQAQVLASTPTTLTVKVPPGASYQPISVTTYLLTGWSANPFVVTFPGIGNQFTPISFAPHADTACGDSPQSVAIGDLDGDGKPDLAIANSNGQTVSILINSSIDGSVSVRSRLPLMSGQSSVAVQLADVNGDGRLDLIVANGQNGVSIFLNTTSNGVLSFGGEQLMPTDGPADHMAAGDLDGDGKADVVIGSALEIGGPVHILHNTSVGDSVSFAVDYELNNLILGNDLDGIAIQDLDGDGLPELILSYYSGNSIMILGNNSTSSSGPSFNQGIILNPGGSSWQIALGDLDGDGKPDMAVATEQLISSSGITVYRNTSSTGSLSFIDQAYMATDGTPYGVAIGDLDGDGHPDIAAGNADFGLVSVFRNMISTSGTLSFAPKVDYATGFESWAVAIGDLDGDGKPDLVTGNYGTGTVSLLRNQIGEPTVTPSGNNPVSGIIVNHLTIDPSVQTLNGSPYVQRHYDIQPDNQPATATATVTLYYTQADFDAFNAYAGHGADLPQGPNDAAGIANLRIYQYHGFSATDIPGTYSGMGLVIDPADSNIVWNAADQWWEVTFTVTGFSGFFASNNSFVYNQTPAPVITAGSSTHLCGSGTVVLQSSADTANQWYKDGILINGAMGDSYPATDSGVYTVTTTHNGLVSPPSAGITVTQSPVPGQPVITLSGVNLQSSAAAGNQWYLDEVALTGATGQSYHPTDTGQYTVRVTLDSCTGDESVAYDYKGAGDSSSVTRVAPNPTKGVVTLILGGSSGGVFQVNIVDMEGRNCMSLGGLVNGSQVSLVNLAPGIYTAHIFSMDGKQVYAVKVVKE